MKLYNLLIQLLEYFDILFMKNIICSFAKLKNNKYSLRIQIKTNINLKSI